MRLKKLNKISIKLSESLSHVNCNKVNADDDDDDDNNNELRKRNIIKGTTEVIEERNYSQSDSRLICVSTGTSKSLILGRCYADEESDQISDEFFIYDEITEYRLAKEVSRSDEFVIENLNNNNKIENDNGNKISQKNGSCFPFRKSLFADVPPYLFFHSYDCACSPLPKFITNHMIWKLSPFTPWIVRKIVVASGFRLVENDSKTWSGTWDNSYEKNGKCLKLHEKINHFPGTNKLGHKDQLWENVNEMIKKFGRKHFAFIPSTYIMPRDKRKLMSVWDDNTKTKWIIKPPNSGCGVGVHVVHQWWEIPVNSYLVVQRYLARPKLIDGAKFDIRLYVLVTSFDPLRIYLYSDGLVRIATTRYDDDVKHLRNRFMHLTNTSVNKYNKSYKLSTNINSATGHLWSLKSLWSLLEKDSVNIPNLWDAMKDIVIKTLISAEGMLAPVLEETLASRYSCFELFGFDILIEENYKPWLLEVNTTPSLHTDSAVHKAIKGPLVRTILNVAGYQLNPGLPKSVIREFARRYRTESVSQNFRIHDKTISHLATRKQFNYMYENSREKYLENILRDLTPDDVRCLIIYEDEITQLELFEKIFPTNRTYKYQKYFKKPRYYDMLFDAWENEYSSSRYRGIERLQKLCRNKFHLIP